MSTAITSILDFIISFASIFPNLMMPFKIFSSPFISLEDKFNASDSSSSVIFLRLSNFFVIIVVEFTIKLLNGLKSLWKNEITFTIDRAKLNLLLEKSAWGKPSLKTKISITITATSKRKDQVVNEWSPRMFPKRNPKERKIPR